MLLIQLQRKIMLNQVQSQKQSHKILPQQIALLNIFHLDCLSLEQRIKDEINENPLLEQTPGDEAATDKCTKETVQDFQSNEEVVYDDIPDYKTEYRNYIATDNLPERQYAEYTDFRAELKKQFRLGVEDESMYKKADFIIDSLNENGFLDQGLEAIADEISFDEKKWVTEEELEAVLKIIQSLEPVGSGSRDIREYLLIQLKLMDNRRPDVKKAITLLEQCFDALRVCNTEKIGIELGLDKDEIQIVLHLISGLKKSPVEAQASTIQVNNVILPDFIVTLEDDTLLVSLAQERSASLFTNNTWNDKLSNVDEATKRYIGSKMAAAKWFIDAVKQREVNMLKVIKAIVAFQHDYFLAGDPMLLKPMVLKNIADKVELDISTISRITCNKYAETPFGTILLKDLFTEGIADQQGNVISNRVLKEVIIDLVKKEDKEKPYTDQQLADMLSVSGYNVARRTVVKYREQSHIPTVKIRRLRGLGQTAGAGVESK
jgi:RNA polymerase sigma-54 factor